MKSKFKGYYKPLPEDFAKIWDDCIFVFDTNVLYDFYRYSDDTVDLLFTIFEKIKDKIWIPHWVGIEYHRGLEDRIREQVGKYSDAIKDLNSFSEKIKTQREHPFLSVELQKEIEEFYVKFNQELTTQKSKLKNLIIENPVKERIADLIGENIGDSLTKEEEEQIVKIGDERLSNNIPPGYVDYKVKKSRPGLDKYGDYIIWQQILKEAKAKKKSFIFVTFDTKEDWYKIIKFNRTDIRIGPRPELAEEFLAIDGCSLWLYPTPEFIEYAVKHLNIEVDASRLVKVKQETALPLDNNTNSECASEIKNENENIGDISAISIGATSSNSSEASGT
ncbi:MAG: PIN domain-containing protein [Bacteroidia bacterium]